MASFGAPRTRPKSARPATRNTSSTSSEAFAATRAFSARTRATAQAHAAAAVRGNEESGTTYRGSGTSGRDIRKRPQSAPPRPKSGSEALSKRFTVAVRVRPFNPNERTQDGRCVACIRIHSNSELQLSEYCSEMDYLRTNRVRSRNFAYDAVFGPDAGQQDVYSVRLQRVLLTEHHWFSS